MFGTRKGCELGSWPRPRNGQEAADVDVYVVVVLNFDREAATDTDLADGAKSLDPWPMQEFVAR